MSTSAHSQVLSVDDDPVYRQLMVEHLQSEGYQMHQAGSVAEARAVLERQAIAVVLLDMNMPGGEGTELLPYIKSLADPVEVIVISGQSSVSVAVEALRLGAFHYLTKPVDLDQVSTYVQRALDHRRIIYENSLMRASRRRDKDAQHQTPCPAL